MFSKHGFFSKLHFTASRTEGLTWRGGVSPSLANHRQARLVFVGEKENSYPCFGWNSYPCYIHVVVQQVEFGLQRQDETAGKKKTHRVSNKSRQKLLQPWPPCLSFGDKHRPPGMSCGGLTWRAWYYHCRPSPTPSLCQGPRRNGAPAACARNQSEG